MSVKLKTKTWITVVLISSLRVEMASGAQSEEDSEKVVKEGSDVEISCQPEQSGTMVVWFRVLDGSRMEFIGSFSPSGTQKAAQTDYKSKFSDRKTDTTFFLKLKSFVKARDSGMYTCTSLYRGQELRFGKVTRLRGGESRFPAEVWSHEGCCVLFFQGGTNTSAFCVLLEENEIANKAPPPRPATTAAPRATTASCACPAATRPGKWARTRACLRCCED